jgi:hypothetical protein
MKTIEIFDHDELNRIVDRAKSDLNFLDWSIVNVKISEDKVNCYSKKDNTIYLCETSISFMFLVDKSDWIGLKKLLIHEYAHFLMDKHFGNQIDEFGMKSKNHCSIFAATNMYLRSLATPAIGPDFTFYDHQDEFRLYPDEAVKFSSIIVKLIKNKCDEYSYDIKDIKIDEIVGYITDEYKEIISYFERQRQKSKTIDEMNLKIENLIIENSNLNYDIDKFVDKCKEQDRIIKQLRGRKWYQLAMG